MNRLLLYAVIASAVVGYFLFSQQKIQNLAEKNAETEIQLKAEEEARQKLTESIQQQQLLLQSAETARRDAERRSSEAMKAFEDSNLNAISVAKPELVERLINRGTERILREIENETRDIQPTVSQ